jgi:hypothetical protein
LDLLSRGSGAGIPYLRRPPSSELLGAGVGSPISWVTHLSKKCDPTQPRQARSVPSHVPSQFRFRRKGELARICPPSRPSNAVPLFESRPEFVSRPIGGCGPHRSQPARLAGDLFPGARIRSLAVIALGVVNFPVVNYLLKVGDSILDSPDPKGWRVRVALLKTCQRNRKIAFRKINVQNTLTAQINAANGAASPIAREIQGRTNGRLHPTPKKNVPTVKTCNAKSSSSFDLGFLVSR